MTAVRDGASVDTSMGFTPLDGTMMATRSGAIDPSVLTYLMRQQPSATASAAAVADELDDALEHHAGLLGISGVSADMRDVEGAADADDARADLALEMFAHRTASTIAAMSASLDRVDALVFTGGIGSHAATMRARIGAKLRTPRHRARWRRERRGDGWRRALRGVRAGRARDRHAGSVVRRA